MRIAIDMQGALTLGSRPRGIGRYTLNLVSAMVRLRRADLHLMLNDNFHRAAVETRDLMQAIDPAVSASLYRTPSSLVHNDRGTSVRRRIAQGVVKRHLASLDADVLLATSCFESRASDFRFTNLSDQPVRLTAAILFDLIPLIFNHVYLTDPDATRSYRENLETLKSANLLLAISESAKRDAERLLGVPQNRIAVIGAAADERFKPITIAPAAADRLKERIGLERDFVMYVAGPDHRKNLKGIVEAVAAMPRGIQRGLQILIVSNPEVHQYEELTRLSVEMGLSDDTVVVARYVSDDDLVNLLNLSRALVFPSLYEGFGLPVLEAMQCGTPVVVADTSSLAEIVDRADLLYDPRSPERAGEILQRLIDDAVFHADVSAWGIARAKAFSWERSARLALEAMDAAAERRSFENIRPSVNRLLDLDGARQEITDVLRLAPAEDGYVASFVADLLFSVPRFNEGGRRLLIDSSVCAQTDAWTGIQRVVRKLTVASYRGAIGHSEVVPVAVRIYGDRIRTATNHLALSLGEERMAEPHDIEFRPGDDLFMLDSNWIEYPDFHHHFFQLRKRGGNVYTCVYDLIPELHPEVCADGMPQTHARWLHAAIARSDGLICISRAVADELLAYIEDNDLPHRPDLRVGWFHCGSDLDGFHSVKPVRDEVRIAFSKDAPAFLAVGTLEPRKCQALAIDAFELLWDQGIEARLVLIGGRGWKVDALADRIRQHPEHGERLFWFEGASDNDVSHAYANAAAVVSMSVAEGFGLPLAEAARLGKAVICSDIPVFREVGGEGAIYFTSGDEVAMADAVQGFLDGRRVADPSRVSRTTWAEAARRIGDVIYGGDWYRELP